MECEAPVIVLNCCFYLFIAHFIIYEQILQCQKVWTIFFSKTLSMGKWEMLVVETMNHEYRNEIFGIMKRPPMFINFDLQIRMNLTNSSESKCWATFDCVVWTLCINQHIIRLNYVPLKSVIVQYRINGTHLNTAFFFFFCFVLNWYCGSSLVMSVSRHI